MSYFKFVLFFFPYLIIRLLNYVLAFPLAIFSVLFKLDVLPGFLKWFHTHDDTLDGGQHQEKWPKVTGLKLIFQRTKWMWRNAAYGFRATVLGVPADGTIVEYSSKGKEYSTYVITTLDGKKYFGYQRPWCWFGWRANPTGGYHIYKCSIRKT